MNELYKRVEEGIKAQPFAGLLHIELKEAVQGEVKVYCEKREELMQQTDLVHGGVIAAVCEAAGGYAALTILPEGSSAVAVEYKINFLRGAAGSGVIAHSKIIKRGRKLIIADVEAYDPASEKLLAKMIITMMPQQG